MLSKLRSGPPQDRRHGPSQDLHYGPSQGHYKGPSQDQSDDCLSVGKTLNIIQINVEGLSQAKIEVLCKLASDHKAHVLLLQETHVDDNITHRLRIPGFDLISSKLHKKHGLASYVHSQLSHSVSILPDVSDIYLAIAVGNRTIYNVYKPPSLCWPLEVLPTPNTPSVFIGDFNSWHTSWGYSKTDVAGDQLTTWASVNNMHLLHDPKGKASFRSGRWNTDTNPDLCFVSSTSQNTPLPSSRTVLPLFPRSQHRPSIITIGTTIPFSHCQPVPRWNLLKAD